MCRDAHECFTDQLRVRLAEYEASKPVLDQLLEAQRFWANSLNTAHLAICDYNNDLTRFEYLQGSILLKRHHIVIAEEATPAAP